jgi:hypothetical protein
MDKIKDNIVDMDYNLQTDINILYFYCFTQIIGAVSIVSLLHPNEGSLLDKK